MPFHFWTPDVYQGVAEPARGLHGLGREGRRLRRAPAGLRLGLPTVPADWQPIVYALAAVTLVVGAVLAVVQTDVKRMLAYSSISHAGFILVGVQAGTDRGHRGGALLPGRRTRSWSPAASGSSPSSAAGRHRPRASTDYRGLASDRPALALAFALFLFAQAGVPLTSGFFAKFYVIDGGRRRRLHLAGRHRHGRRRSSPRSCTCGSSSRCSWSPTPTSIAEPRRIPIPFAAGIAISRGPARHPGRRPVPEPHIRPRRRCRPRAGRRASVRHRTGRHRALGRARAPDLQIRRFDAGPKR